MRRNLGAILIFLPGLLGLGIGGYFVLKNVFGISLSGHGPEACKVLTPAIAKGVLGGSAQLTQRQQLNPQETLCVYATSSGRFISLTVGSWDFIQSEAPSSGKSNQGIGAGTYLLNTGVSTDSTIAEGSATGRVARKGGVGISVTAGNYGQFVGADAVRELALEDRLEAKLVPELLSRV